MDVYEMDRQRILGITRGAEVAQRVRQDAELRAAMLIEQEARAEVAARQEALAAEAQAREQARAEAGARLVKLKPLYPARQEAAANAIAAIATVYQIEAEIQAGLNDAFQPLRAVLPQIEPSQHAGLLEGLRVKAGLPSQHIYAPDVQPTDEGQAVGVTVIRAITANVIQPGAIVAGRDVLNI